MVPVTTVPPVRTVLFDAGSGTDSIVVSFFDFWVRQDPRSHFLGTW